MDLPAAQKRLNDIGLGVEVRRETSDDVRDTVLDVDPDAGSIVLRGKELKLTVSAGPQIADLIDLKGMPLEDAEQWLKDAGFPIGTIEERFDPAPKGVVIEQDPKKGRHRKDTPVNIVVSAGPEMVDVPAVTQKSFEEAKAALEAVGLKAVREEVFNDADPETVVDQTPKPGEKAAKGSEVRLAVSKGSEPFAMPNVKGKGCSDAKGELESLGLVVVTNSQKGGPCGSTKVLDQDPLQGTMVRKGQEVTLYIA
jgi:serine/threonine-protein kinase